MVAVFSSTFVTDCVLPRSIYGSSLEIRARNAACLLVLSTIFLRLLAIVK